MTDILQSQRNSLFNQIKQAGMALCRFVHCTAPIAAISVATTAASIALTQTALRHLGATIEGANMGGLMLGTTIGFVGSVLIVENLYRPSSRNQKSNDNKPKP